MTASHPIRDDGQEAAESRARQGLLSADGSNEVIACWSAKGGAGTTVVAAALALRLADASPTGALLVDGAGDLPAALGMSGLDSPGLAGWMRGDRGEGPAEVSVRPGLSLVPRGQGPLVAEHGDELAGLLAHERRPVVVDCGTAPCGAMAAVADKANRSILVTRPCYLALHRAVSEPLPRPTGVIVVNEPGRVLEAQDIAAALAVPILAEVSFDHAVARSVDAGLLAGRVPRSLDADLANVCGPSRCVTRESVARLDALQAVAGPDAPEVSAR